MHDAYDMTSMFSLLFVFLQCDSNTSTLSGTSPTAYEKENKGLDITLSGSKLPVATSSRKKNSSYKSFHSGSFTKRPLTISNRK